MPLLTITREDAAGNPAVGLAFTIVPLIGDVTGATTAATTASGLAFTADSVIGGDPIEGVLDANGEAVVNLTATDDTNDTATGRMRYRIEFATGGLVTFTMPEVDVRLEDTDP